MDLTIREVIRRTGLSDEAIRNRIISGAIEAKRQGNRYLIPEEELSKLPKPRNIATDVPIPPISLIENAKQAGREWADNFVRSAKERLQEERYKPIREYANRPLGV